MTPADRTIKAARLRTGVGRASIDQAITVVRACVETDPSFRLTFGDPEFWRAFDDVEKEIRDARS